MKKTFSAFWPGFSNRYEPFYQPWFHWFCVGRMKGPPITPFLPPFTSLFQSLWQKPIYFTVSIIVIYSFHHSDGNSHFLNYFQIFISLANQGDATGIRQAPLVRTKVVAGHQSHRKWYPRLFNNIVENNLLFIICSSLVIILLHMQKGNKF